MTRPLHTVKGRHGIVTAPHYLAAQAGLGVLEDGGSAAQATITVAATLAVVYPHMTGIGGDGFWLIRESDGRLHGVHGVGAAAARPIWGSMPGRVMMWCPGAGRWPPIRSRARFRPGRPCWRPNLRRCRFRACWPRPLRWRKKALS
jgi:hypothetical protein